MKKPIIINAFHGLGDIIFSIPIYRRLIADGHKVIHPYLTEYGPIWKHWPEITWIPKDQLKINYDNRGYVENEFFKIIPLRWANTIRKGDRTQEMRAKYDFMGMDYWDWQTVTWVRDMEKEQELFQRLGIAEGEPFALVNTFFKHNRSGRARIAPVKGMKNVPLQKLDGFTLMDWGLVMERAAEIHTVGTSINYLLDPAFLNIHCPIHVYKRLPDETDFLNYGYLLRKEYVWH